MPRDRKPVARFDPSPEAVAPWNDTSRKVRDQVTLQANVRHGETPEDEPNLSVPDSAMTGATTHRPAGSSPLSAATSSRTAASRDRGRNQMQLLSRGAGRKRYRRAARTPLDVRSPPLTDLRAGARNRDQRACSPTFSRSSRGSSSGSSCRSRSFSFSRSRSRSRSSSRSRSRSRSRSCESSGVEECSVYGKDEGPEKERSRAPSNTESNYQTDNESVCSVSSVVVASDQLENGCWARSQVSVGSSPESNISALVFASMSVHDAMARGFANGIRSPSPISASDTDSEICSDPTTPQEEANGEVASGAKAEEMLQDASLAPCRAGASSQASEMRESPGDEQIIDASTERIFEDRKSSEPQLPGFCGESEAADVSREGDGGTLKPEPGAQACGSSGEGSGARKQATEDGLVRIRLARSQMPKRFKQLPPAFESCLTRVADEDRVGYGFQGKGSWSDDDIMSTTFNDMGLQTGNDLEDTAWLTSDLLDAIMAKFARTYRGVHFMPTEFAAFSLRDFAYGNGVTSSSARTAGGMDELASLAKDCARYRDILGRPVVYAEKKDTVFAVNLNGMHWNLVRVQHLPVPEVQLFEPFGKQRRKAALRSVGRSEVGGPGASRVAFGNPSGFPLEIFHWLDTAWSIQEGNEDVEDTPDAGPVRNLSGKRAWAKNSVSCDSGVAGPRKKRKVAQAPYSKGWVTRAYSAITQAQQTNGYDCGVAILLYAEKCGQGFMREDIDTWTDQLAISAYRSILQAYAREASRTPSSPERDGPAALARPSGHASPRGLSALAPYPVERG